jgi:hypothetical protein
VGGRVDAQLSLDIGVLLRRALPAPTPTRLHHFTGAATDFEALQDNHQVLLTRFRCLGKHDEAT